jgi:hypothetical protein
MHFKPASAGGQCTHSTTPIEISEQFEIIGVIIDLNFGQQVQHIETKNAEGPNVGRASLLLPL